MRFRSGLKNARTRSPYCYGGVVPLVHRFGWMSREFFERSRLSLASTEKFDVSAVALSRLRALDPVARQCACLRLVQIVGKMQGLPVPD